MNFQLLAFLAVTCLVSAVPIQQSPTSGVATVSVDADLPADFRLYGLARLPAIPSFTLDNNNWEAPVGVTWRAQNTGPTPITYAIQFKSNVCTANDGYTFLLVDGAGTRSFIPNSGTGCSVSVTFNDQAAADSDSVANKIRGQVYLVRPFGFVPPSTSTTTTTTTTSTSRPSTSTSTRTTTSTTSTSRTSTSTRTTTTSTRTTTTSTRTTTTSTTTRTSTSTTRTSTSTTRTSTSTTRTSTSTTRTSTSTTRTSTSTTRTSTTFTSTTFTSTTFIPTTTAVPINFVNRRLNYLLNVKYLAAEYFFAALGRSPSYSGAVNGTVNGGQVVNFTSPGYQSFADEICNDYEAHIVALRNFLGSAAINRPDLNINGGFNSTFSRAVRAAGVFAGFPNSTLAAFGNFTPYANDLYFFLMGSGLADVVAQAERNTFAQINDNQNATGLLAGIFGTDSYHAGHLRALIYGRRNEVIVPASNDTNNSNITLGQIYGVFAGWVNSLAGGNNGNNSQNVVDSNGNANIAPTGNGGSLNGYTPRQVLNILYGNANNSTNGLFFPNGFNGNLNGVL